MPWLSLTTPAPPHVGHADTFDPGSAPEPWHTEHAASRVRWIVVDRPWAASPTAEWTLVGKRNQGDLAGDLNRQAKQLGVGLAAHPPLTWNHAASCGIWCRGAAIAVRNVTVETTPYPPD